MTKLEEKLIELGYEYIPFEFDFDCKLFRSYFECGAIEFNVGNNKVKDSKIRGFVRTQEDINSLQQAYNEMQKDLEELRKYD